MLLRNISSFEVRLRFQLKLMYYLYSFVFHFFLFQAHLEEWRYQERYDFKYKFIISNEKLIRNLSTVDDY
jgi:hypothetical protein